MYAAQGGIRYAIPVFNGGGASGHVVPSIHVFYPNVVGHFESMFIGYCGGRLKGLFVHHAKFQAICPLFFVVTDGFFQIGFTVVTPNAWVHKHPRCDDFVRCAVFFVL